MRAAGYLLTFALAVMPAAAAEKPDGRQLHAPPSPLAGLLERLPGMPANQRLDLAVAIVEQLAGAYETELEQAVLDMRRDSGRRSVHGWYRATLPVLAEIRSTQAALHAAREVDIYQDRHNQVLIVIDDDLPLHISWPRLSMQRLMEREIAAAFCQRHACADRDVDDGTGIPSVDPAALQGRWTLSQLHPPTWESGDGVSCEFADLSDRGEKEATCRALIADLHATAAALRAAIRRGEPIDWPHLTVSAGAGDGLQAVTVNARGDYIPVSAPALVTHPVYWGETRRWLEARVHDLPASATVLRSTGKR